MLVRAVVASEVIMERLESSIGLQPHCDPRARIRFHRESTRCRIGPKEPPTPFDVNSALASDSTMAAIPVVVSLIERPVGLLESRISRSLIFNSRWDHHRTFFLFTLLFLNRCAYRVQKIV